ncbi:MAG: alpha-1,2-fucosyltransferase [Pseudomonadota bacterium]
MEVEVKFMGRLANRLFQYCFGRIIADALQFDLSSQKIPDFDAAVSVKRSEPMISSKALETEIFEGHIVNLEEIFEKKTPRIIRLQGYFQRYEYYKDHKDQIREWLQTSVTDKIASDKYSFGDKDLTISIRSGDIWQHPEKKTVHGGYCALPYSFYQEIIESEEWDQIYIVTEDPSDLMIRKLVEEYSCIVYSNSPVEDFCILKSSKNIVLSVSTFAWWASWLSEASQVFMPIAGVFDRKSRSDINLVVDDEDRYNFIEVDVEHPWTGSHETRVKLLNV